MFILAVTLVSGCLSPDCSDLGNENTDAYYCESDADCVLYISPCCPVVGSTAFNKKYESCIPQGNDVNLFGEPCGYSCKLIPPGREAPTFTECHNNRCVPLATYRSGPLLD